jgi:7-carboxy-7-deazaguanine synthase
MEIAVQERFAQTVQGEGYWVGALVDFIRLYGCPVQCWYCDQDYADGGGNLPYQKRTITDLIAELKSPRVVISGGEPMIHRRLPDLCEAIHTSGRAVHIETSGGFMQDIPMGSWVTLSPKEHLNPKYPVLASAWERCNEVKIVISSGDELGFYGHQLEVIKGKLVYLQPEWGDRERTISLVLELIKRNPTYRFSGQLHKYLGVY